MNKLFQTATIIGAVALSTALLLGQAASSGDKTQEDEKARVKAERKKQDIARAFAQNARTFTLFDRAGKSAGTIGQRAMIGNPTFSPDGKRVAYTKADLDKETQDLWIMDLENGKEIQLTASKAREGTSPAIWSPDGSQVVYAGLRDGNFSVYRKASNGQGAEELLHKLAGVGSPTDWSADGKYLAISASDLGGGTISALPLNAGGERKPVEIFHSAKQVQGGRISPDGHLIAYLSNETGKNEVYIRAFNPEGAAAAGVGGPWKISEDGGLGMTAWRKDGREFYFMAADRSIMTVAVNASPVGFEKPKRLFQPAPEIAANPGAAAISSDGQKVLIAVPPPQMRQLTILDRQGKPVRTVGEPTQFVVQPHFSPDGRMLTYMKQDPKTSDVDVWTFDLENAKEYPVTRDNWPENAPIWAPDGKHVIYASTRDNYAGIYRKNWDGTGAEELLFRYTPGAGMVLTDITPDAKYVTFYTGVLVLAPVTGSGDPLERKSIDWLRDEYDNLDGKFSPDGRFIAYAANPDDPMALDVFVRPFDAEKPASGQPVRITKNGIASGMICWRGDGKELYFMTRDQEVMAVDISTSPTFTAGAPKMLFKLPVQPVGNPMQWDNVSRDGQRFVFSLPAAR